jgi:hypothetical protein
MMKTGLAFLVLLGLCVTGYSLNWLSGHQPSPKSAGQADPMSEAAWRHKTCQPRHWRSLVLQMH